MPSVDALTPLGWKLLGDLPPRVVEDPDFRAVVHCVAKESEREKALGERVRDNLIAARVDDLGLEWWESLFMLPDPEGMSDEQRAARILARSRQTGPRVAAFEFQADMDSLVGAGTWSFEEEWPAIRVFTSYPPGSEGFLALENLIRGLPSFPAHLDIILENVEGFILDESQLDQDPFQPE